MTESWFELALRFDVFLALSALMYVIFAVGLFALGAEYHKARITKSKDVGQFPPGYFTMLAAQLLPLAITGFILADPYIIGTRVGTLGIVLLVYGMTISVDGTFSTWRFKLWVLFWLSVAIIGPMVWSESETVRTFVRDFEIWIAWGAVALMVVFVWRGQRAVAKALFKHFLEGNYTIKRLSLQVVRFFGFLFQAVHYLFIPSGAKTLFGIDPIFLQGAIGTAGVAAVLIGALIGFIRGSSVRRRNRTKDRLGVR